MSLLHGQILRDKFLECLSGMEWKPPFRQTGDAKIISDLHCISQRRRPFPSLIRSETQAAACNRMSTRCMCVCVCVCCAGTPLCAGSLSPALGTRVLALEVGEDWLLRMSRSSHARSETELGYETRGRGGDEKYTVFRRYRALIHTV